MRSVFDHNEKFFENDISDLRTQVGGLTIRTDSPEPEDTNERQASPTRAYITISQVRALPLCESGAKGSFMADARFM